MPRPVHTVRFEVFGKVQGVFFRKHTKKMCDRLGLTGWVINTKKGTVQGYMEGPNQELQTAKQWLQTEGSPKSRIDGCKFYDEKPATKSHSQFVIITSPSEVEQKTIHHC